MAYQFSLYADPKQNSGLRTLGDRTFLVLTDENQANSGLVFCFARMKWGF